MKAQIVRNITLLLLMIGGTVHAASLRGDFQKGQNLYTAGRFKEAIAQFQLITDADPNDAESHLWLGRSYAMVADINAPAFSGRAHSKAHTHFRKAVQLAPENAEYRREFFNFLLDADGSPSALKEAQTLVQSTPTASLDHLLMRARLEQERKEHRSPEGLTADLFLFVPQHTTGILP